LTNRRVKKMRVRVVDDLEIIEIDDQYLLKSDTLDRFCVVNRSGFDLVSRLQKEKWNLLG
jgi:hypothetical protein